jgi:hypothetical protein
MMILSAERDISFSEKQTALVFDSQSGLVVCNLCSIYEQIDLPSSTVNERSAHTLIFCSRDNILKRRINSASFLSFSRSIHFGKNTWSTVASSARATAASVFEVVLFSSPFSSATR